MRDESSDILEGFICPICKSDERKLEKLLQHFEEKHSDEKDLIQTFKVHLAVNLEFYSLNKFNFQDVFKIAKKKILNLDETELSRAIENTIKTGFTSNFSKELVCLEFEAQDIGLFRDHIGHFKAERSPRLERYATETNKLIIRLNKLLINRPVDQQQIKLHEQNVRQT